MARGGKGMQNRVATRVEKRKITSRKVAGSAAAKSTPPTRT